jgi:hypothetical protein
MSCVQRCRALVNPTGWLSFWGCSVVLKSLMPVSEQVLLLSYIGEAECGVHRFSVGYAAVCAGIVGANLGLGVLGGACKEWLVGVDVPRVMCRG